jgi:hypothetical protein
MKRKETYATSGTRMTVRSFGGWDFTKEDAQSRQLADAGYAKGVPMGSDLAKAPAGARSPTFLVAAMKDPMGGNLDRIQIIKGWAGGQGRQDSRGRQEGRRAQDIGRRDKACGPRRQDPAARLR